MATVFIPALLRDLCGGRETVTVAGATVREIVDRLDAQFPGIKDRLCQGDELRASIAVAVGAEVSRQGLSAAVAPDSEVHFVPAISGGNLGHVCN
ncbi:MAG: MoaD/ThiS family protein [Gemmataceae bacterium]|nr:MoaD/ThiS family protein [Gemmataceae bacterium]